MADFVAVLKKTIGGLNDNTPQARERVYQRARDAVAAKLAAMQPAPSSIVVERQKKALETAISAVESSFTHEEEPEDEFAAIFSGASGNSAEKAGPVAEEASEPVAETAPEPVADASPAEPEPAEEPEAAEQPVPAASHDADAEAGPEMPMAADIKPAETVARPAPILPGSAAKEDTTPERERPTQRNRKRVSGGLIAALVAIVVIAAAGYGIWLNRDAFMAMIAPADTVATAPEAEATPVSEQTVTEETAPATEETAAAEEATPVEESAAAEETQAAAATEEEQQKFTQRLTEEGDEVDPGPAGGDASIGEGTSVASATQNGGEGGEATTGTEAPATPGGSQQATLPVGQRAIFYEERTTASDSTAEAGATVWSIVQESPGGDLPPEPAIRAEVTVPSKGIQLRMTIRRNADASLPASHIIEMIFLTSDGFEGGGIDNVLRVALKPSEAAPGNPLIGIPAKIADGYFLIALSNVPEERDFNLELMRRQSWIDIPIVYSSGRRALVTMERGVPGDRAFIDALATWDKLASEEESAAATAGN